MTSPRDDLLAQDALRYRILREVYHRSGKGHTKVIDLLYVAKELELDPQEVIQAGCYLADERLLKAHQRQRGLVEISHDGILEVEASIRHPDVATEHFPVPVIQSVTYNFHGAVGSVQTGAHSVAHVVQNLGPSAEEVLALIERLREELAVLPSHREEAQELLQGMEIEVRAEQPGKTRFRAAADALGRLLEGTTASAAGTILAEILAKMLHL